MERQYRLQGRNRFLEIREQGRRWVHPLAVLGGQANGLSFSRYGFIVSRKLGNAVTRNRIRRRLREVMRLCYRQVRPGWDLVLIARPPICQAGFGEITATVEGLLRQAGLWQPPEESSHA